MDTLVNQDNSEKSFALDIKKKILRTKDKYIQEFINLAKDMVNDEASKGYFETKFSINMYTYSDTTEVEKRYKYERLFFGGLPWTLFKSRTMRQHVEKEFESQTGLKMTITPRINPLVTLFTMGMWLKSINVKITH